MSVTKGRRREFANDRRSAYPLLINRDSVRIGQKRPAGNFLEGLVGLGRLELPTSPLSGARSSHLSYRPFENAWNFGYSPFSLRCLSLIRNCVQIRSLCTRQQFLYHLSFLSVLKMRVVAGDSQIRMANLIFHEVTGHHARLHVADSTMSKSVHSTWSEAELLADWRENPPADVSVFQWRAEP